MKESNGLITFFIVLLFIGWILEPLGLDLDQRTDSKYWESCQCSDDYKGEELRLGTPEEREEEILDNILKAHGLSGESYKLCTTKEIPGYADAYATMKDGLNYIICGQEYTKTASYLGLVCLMAHEVGHHVHKHTTTDNSPQKEQELEADRFSGESLFKLGYSLEESVNVYSMDYEGTDVHSPGPIRREAIKKGWLKAEYAEKKKNLSASTARTPKQESESSLEESPISEYDLINAKKLVSAFITALGNQNFEEAYYMQAIKAWGSLDDFSSNNSFGGITQTKILAAPAIVEHLDKREKNYILAKVFIRYLAIDPVNDECQSGRIYDQFFWVKGLDNQWLITRARLREAKCFNDEDVS
jgi:hypothetical protein